MQNLYTIFNKSEVEKENLTAGERFSVLYHDIFDFPLTFSELIKWSGASIPSSLGSPSIIYKNGYYFIAGRNGIIYKRILRKRISDKKMEIAKRAAKILSFIPGVKMIAVTGSLAMGNSTDESDIDLMVITKKGSLWTTRLFAYFTIRLFSIRTRRPMDKAQKDKLCLNIWLDESDLSWPKKDRNVYSAHELGQIKPLVNKNRTYEKLLSKNMWILDFWPNSVKVRKLENKRSLAKSEFGGKSGLLEKVAFKLQCLHMRSKITRETITPSRALFHPQDWGKVVIERLNSI
jgi:predicted nucleotidyltransferase